ncbi:MAG: pyridoxamine 5'-phosphate oxidase family protein [Chloroflexota bacterium]|nr:MAG: pyridoxamine 5'-phosphate oxidase family protein [Chloroflexota bacterium]
MAQFHVWGRRLAHIDAGHPRRPAMTTMTAVRDPVGKIDPEFSDPAASPTPWWEVRQVLETAQVYWLSTVRGDGRPHVTPIAGVWVDDAVHVATGDDEQKQRNLRGNVHTVLTTGCSGLVGTDVVVEADADEVTDLGRLQVVAEAYASKYRNTFPYEVGEGHLKLRDARDSVIRCYRLRANKVFAFKKDDPVAQTKFLADEA